MKETYLAVTGRIRRELQELAQVVERQVEVLIRQLQPTMEQVSQELLAFADFLEKLGLDG
ncbi:MAG: hypothetical protein ACE5F6_04595 [Anaerolineae bacterium]